MKKNNSSSANQEAAGNQGTSSYTPLFQQYFRLKGDYPGCLVLMQCGDFFEAYGDDAQTFAADLGIALTAKEAGNGQKVAMAGVPFHAVDGYLRGLVKKGHRVAVAEQMADPATCKGLVPREVTRVVTAGTVLDDNLLDAKSHNYLACLVQGRSSGRVSLGLAVADISTGDFSALESDNSLEPAEGRERLLEELGSFSPQELVLAGHFKGGAPLPGGEPPAEWAELAGLARTIAPSLSFFECRDDAEAAGDLLRREFGLAGLQGLGLEKMPQATLACGCLLRYLKTISVHYGITLGAPHALAGKGHMLIDASSRRNLELTETLMGRERQGSLLGCLDRTCTSMGARRLSEMMLRPLDDAQAISFRHDLVEALVLDKQVCAELRGTLRRMLDLERLTARSVFGTANARDLLALGLSLDLIPALSKLLARLPQGAEVERLRRDMCPQSELCALLLNAVHPEPSASLRDGGIIRTGYNAELDELRRLRGHSKDWLASLEERERSATGIRNLKVGYTSVFGYYIEVSKGQIGAVPAHYVRRQTLTNCERYIIPELKEHESHILGAEDRIKKLEYELFVELRNKVARQAENLRTIAGAVADTDVYANLACVAAERNWVRPVLDSECVIDLHEARHPVVELARAGEFVPNNCYLDRTKRIIILTGPNMSGKSTWLRQTALAAVLCQMGSFVPAAAARLGVFDRVFTRVGASDDLHLGQSTFMVEMSETANIVNNATARSLVILDEIGRGTSTFDGLALARAVVEHLHDSVGCLTLFATHFHELTRLERALPGCRNHRVSVREMPEEVVFLHKIVPGAADRSYGVYVAKLAGMPESVLHRAEYLLKRLESSGRRQREMEPELPVFRQSGLFDSLEDN